MATNPPTLPGSIGWMDLTVNDAVGVRDFYSSVVGWRGTGLSMGDYEDFCMFPRGSKVPVCGICHARGENADMPPQWLIYVNVANLDRALERCLKGGGAVVSGPREMAGSQMAVIRDPAGAVLALFQAAKPAKARKKPAKRTTKAKR